MKSHNVARQPAKLAKSGVLKTREDGQRPITIRKILVPTDFSQASRKSLSYALRLPEELNSEITLLHFLEPEAPVTSARRPVAAAALFPEQELADAEDGLRGLTHSAKAAGSANTKSLLRTGVATHEIVEVAKELDVDLIVIATHGFTGWKHFAIGSTAERVARAAPCPVLVVREKEHDFIKVT